MKKVKNLSKIDIKNLSQLYKTSKKRRIRERSHLILLSSKNITVKELSNIFVMCRQSVCSLIDSYNKKGELSLCDSPRSGRPSKISVSAKKKILEMLSKDSRNLNLILEELKDNFSIEISKKTLIRFIKKKSLFGNECVNR